MKHKNNHFAVGYWSSVRRGRPVPTQADIDPRALKRLLPIIFLLDAPEGGAFSYRLAGTAICERYGTELRGTEFLARWDAASRARLSGLLRDGLRERLPVCVTSIGATEDCRMVEIETVFMPIGVENKAPSHFLAVAQILTEGTPLFGRPITLERMVAGALVHENGPAPEIAPAAAQADTAFSAAEAPHLRLVVSQERPPQAPATDASGLRRLWTFSGGTKPGAG